MFYRMGLNNNLDNTKSMVCMPGFIWGKWCDKAYKLQSTVEGKTIKERKRMWVSCTKCVVTVAALYLKQLMARLHVICAPNTRGVGELWGVPTTYVVSFPIILRSVICPVLG